MPNHRQIFNWKMFWVDFLIILTQLHLGTGDIRMSCMVEYDPNIDYTRSLQKWPNARIPYTVDSNMDQNAVSELNGAINEFHTKTCLRFEYKSGSDYNHVHVKIEDTGYCGLAQFCRRGNGRQYVRMRPDCAYVAVIVHELGHAICLDHEHARPDRSSYLQYPECSNPSDIEKIEDHETTRIQIYDYYSQMHYYCGGCYGTPKKPNVNQCGPAVNPVGLSAVDADRINEFYDCRGCFRHRWYRADTLTTNQEATLVNFASHVDGHEPTYLCRGFYDGALISGTYVPSEKACHIAFDANAFWIFDDVQVFGLPNGPNGPINNMTSSYRFYSPYEEDIKSLIAIGTGVATLSGYPMTIYAAVHELIDSNGATRVLLGVMDTSLVGLGLFPNDNESLFIVQDSQTDKIEFYIIGCQR